MEGVYNDGTISRVGRVGRIGVKGQQQTKIPAAASMAAWLTALFFASFPKAKQALSFNAEWSGWDFMAPRMHCRSGCG